VANDAAGGPVTGLGYTLPAALAVLAVCAWELAFLRTGLFRRPAYWLTMLIVLAFQVPVDGWLTKLSAPIVLYAPRPVTGLRGPWDIPVEDFLFGFALVTAALLAWERQGSGDRPGSGRRPARAGGRRQAERTGSR
jgi:lycopene cyclase domain-containing protein